jgi:hypothetical protein
MFGKVLGASLAGMLQLVLVLGSAYLFYNLNASYYTDSDIVRSIFAMPLSMLLYTLLFFVLGFLLYAFLYASLASLVSRMEELSTVIMPVTFLFVFAFMVVMFSHVGRKGRQPADGPVFVYSVYLADGDVYAYCHGRGGCVADRRIDCAADRLDSRRWDPCRKNLPPRRSVVRYTPKTQSDHPHAESGKGAGCEIAI